MPTFDFLCTACNSTFEFSRPFGSTEHPKCPACGSKKTEKQIAPPVIQFKGKGFYKTDSQKMATPAKHTKPTEPNKPNKPTEHNESNEPTKPPPPAAPKKEDSKPK